MRVGEERPNNFGTPMKIVKIVKENDIDVEFLDEHHFIKTHTTYGNFKNGCIKNPYDKTCWGVGYIGVGKYIRHNSDGNMNIVYNVWRSMIERCYSERHKDAHRSYYGISECCEEWWNYQTFAEWYKANEYGCEGRLHLDKDILIEGNKLYSPDRCLLVPQRINLLFMNKSNNRGLPNGVYKNKDGYYAKLKSKDLGTYATIEDAYRAYAKERKRVVIEVANEFKGKIPTKVYDALMGHEFRIENDKNYK